MRTMLTVLAIAGGAIFLAPASASAEVWYPWCITYAGGQDGIGATSCAFVSRAQCMMTAQGMAAMCVENVVPPPGPPPRERRRRHHYDDYGR